MKDEHYRVLSMYMSYESRITYPSRVRILSSLLYARVSRRLAQSPLWPARLNKPSDFYTLLIFSPSLTRREVYSSVRTLRIHVREEPVKVE